MRLNKPGIWRLRPTVSVQSRTHLLVSLLVSFNNMFQIFLENYDSFAELFGASGISSFWEFPSQDMDMALRTDTGLFNDDIKHLFPSVDQRNDWLMQQE